MNSLRVLVIGGRLSYRALFTWLNPWIYIPTMLGGPFFQILFFAYLGRYSKVHDDTYFVVGNAVQASSMAAVHGVARTIGYERLFSTLAPILASPANRTALFFGRVLPLIIDGLLVSSFGLLTGYVLLDFHPPLGAVPPLALVLVITVVANTAFGMTLGAIGLRARDVLFSANLAYFLMLLVCGTNVPLHVLPGWLAAVGRALPLTHGIEAARQIAGGASLSAVERPLLTDLGLGVAWAVASIFLLRLFESESRRRATLDTL
jgi:ABC-2 type transport system permease protein